MRDTLSVMAAMTFWAGRLGDTSQIVLLDEEKIRGLKSYIGRIRKQHIWLHCHLQQPWWGTRMKLC